MKKFVIYTKKYLVLMTPYHFIVILQIFDRITSYPNGTSAGKICKKELLNKYMPLILMMLPLKIKYNII